MELQIGQNINSNSSSHSFSGVYFWIVWVYLMGMPFPDPLLMKSAYGRRGIITTDIFRYWSERYKLWITVPKGTYSNFGSVPSIIPPFIAPRVGKIKEGYVIHDWIYQNKGKMPNGVFVTKHQADMMLYDAMKTLDVNAIRRGIILSGVKANLYAKYKWS